MPKITVGGTEDVPLMTFERHAFHEECGGELVSTGMGRGNMAGNFMEHVCKKCGERGDIKNASYPEVIHKRPKSDE